MVVCFEIIHLKFGEKKSDSEGNTKGKGRNVRPIGLSESTYTTVHCKCPLKEWYWMGSISQKLRIIGGEFTLDSEEK